jgi:hypothetical protein
MDIDPLSAAFLAFLGLGLLWITWRISRYVRFHRERDYAWSRFASDEEFHNFIEALRNSKRGEVAGPTSEAPPDNTSHQVSQNAPRPGQPRE